MQWLIERLLEYGDREAIVLYDRPTRYSELAELVQSAGKLLDELKVSGGESVAVYGDYGPATTGMVLALALRRCLVVPIAASERDGQKSVLQTAEVSVQLDFTGNELRAACRHDVPAVAHPLLQQLRQAQQPGVILFSSGSTGTSKGIVLNFEKLLSKMERRRAAYRTLAFLIFGHVGGMNTLLRTLANGGTIITTEGRQPADICEAIERYQVNLLPTTPTFLTMLLMSEVYQKHRLDSLQLITYGTEPMPESTLHSLRSVFPNVVLKQTYGMSELGILPTKSKDSDSLYMKVVGDGFETKVINDILWVRADTAMLGYLNAPSPFSEGGWLSTGDVVDVQGEYFRILGRESELINVGGEKVYPAEVESVLLEVQDVQEAAVYGKFNPITGQVVCAQVSLASAEDHVGAIRRIKRHCRTRLRAFKVPVIIEVTNAVLHGARFKKVRPVSLGENAVAA